METSSLHLCAKTKKLDDTTKPQMKFRINSKVSIMVIVKKILFDKTQSENQEHANAMAVSHPVLRANT